MLLAFFSSKEMLNTVSWNIAYSKRRASKLLGQYAAMLCPVILWAT